MLDIKFIRENADIVKADLKKRNDPEKLNWVDDLTAKDKEYRHLLAELELLRNRRNIIYQEINQLKKEGRDIKDKLNEAKELPEKIAKEEEKVNSLKEKITYYLMRLPNILHKSVPVGKDETENKLVRKAGIIKKFDFELKTHGELIENLGLGNFDQAANVSGKGFY